jgi:hypothetical protein
MQRQQESVRSAPQRRSRLDLGLSWLLTVVGGISFFIWVMGVGNVGQRTPVQLFGECLLAALTGLGFLGGLTAVLRHRRLAQRLLTGAGLFAGLVPIMCILVCLDFARQGMLFPGTLIRLALIGLAFVSLGVLLTVLGRWLGQQDDSEVG